MEKLSRHRSGSWRRYTPPASLTRCGSAVRASLPERYTWTGRRCRGRYGNAKASQSGLPSRVSNCFSFYLRTQGVILGIDAVELQEIRVQASCMVADIAEAEDKIRSKLVLDFKAPVLHHAGTPIAWRHIDGRSLKPSIQKCRICGIGRRSEAVKTSIQRLYRSKSILRSEIRIRGGPASKLVPKVRVAKRSIIDTVSAADRCVA